MKILSWADHNKWQLISALFAIITLYFFIRSMKSDNSLDLTKQKIEFIEEKNRAVISERAAWAEVIRQKDIEIYSWHIKDSIAKAGAQVVDTKLNQLPKYNEKYKIIDAFGDDDLRKYIRDLPDPGTEDDH